MNKKNNKTHGAPNAGSELKDLWPGQSHELLKALHILTRDGKLNQDSRRKLKQVQHLVQLIQPGLEDQKLIVDLGAGKSYLGFMLYDLWMRERADTSLIAIESRESLIETSREIAVESGFDRIQFVCGTIQEARTSREVPPEVDVVTALHACDTATDDSIIFAIEKKAKFIALVPCCQAEVARWLESLKDSKTSLNALWRHPHHRREFGSHLTNVIRALALEALGYKVRVTELIGWEHAMKNELLVASKVQGQNSLAKRSLINLLREISPDLNSAQSSLYLLKRLRDLGLDLTT